jgi:hypothetical protein
MNTKLYTIFTQFPTDKISSRFIQHPVGVEQQIRLHTHSAHTLLVGANVY